MYSNGWAKRPEATEPTPEQYLKRCPLVDASDMTPEEFARRFGEPNVPVLLAGLMDDWPASRKWTVQVSAAWARHIGACGCYALMRLQRVQHPCVQGGEPRCALTRSRARSRAEPVSQVPARSLPCG